MRLRIQLVTCLASLVFCGAVCAAGCGEAPRSRRAAPAQGERRSSADARDD